VRKTLLHIAIRAAAMRARKPLCPIPVELFLLRIGPGEFALLLCDNTIMPIRQRRKARHPVLLHAILNMELQ
jgi:hypothetical protein